MWVTMLLLAALYSGFIFFALYNGLTWMLVIVGVLVLVQFALSDRMVLASMRAKVVTPEEAPRLHRMVEDLSRKAGIPKPKVAISQMSVPNAFATGRSQKHAAVAVTTGLLNILSDDELEAVLAHEISHIRTKDVVVMTYASFFLIVASMLSTFLFYSAIFGGMSRNRDNNQGGGAAAILVIMLVVMLVRIIGSILVATLSRYREYSADRGAAILTRQPMALASALQRLQGTIAAVPHNDLRKAEGMNAFFIMSAVGQGVVELFASHPSTEKRVARLREYAQQLGTLR
jgi:heat shock protein HtpX